MRLSEPLHFVAIPCDSNRWRLKSLKKNKYNLATSFYFKYFYFLKQDKISKQREESLFHHHVLCWDIYIGWYFRGSRPGTRRMRTIHFTGRTEVPWNHSQNWSSGSCGSTGSPAATPAPPTSLTSCHTQVSNAWFYLRNCFLNSDNKQRNHNTQCPLVNSWWMINDKYPSLVFDFFALHHRQQETFILVCFTSIS